MAISLSIISTIGVTGVNRAHLAQTAHSEKTAQERYLSKNGTTDERRYLLDIYSQRLTQRAEDEDDTEQQPPEQADDESDLDGGEVRAEALAPPTPIQYPPPVTRFNMIRDSLQNAAPPPPASQPIPTPSCQPDVNPTSTNLPNDQPGLSTQNHPRPVHRQRSAKQRDSLESNESRLRLIFFFFFCTIFMQVTFEIILWINFISFGST